MKLSKNGKSVVCCALFVLVILGIVLFACIIHQTDEKNIKKTIETRVVRVFRPMEVWKSSTIGLHFAVRVDEQGRVIEAWPLAKDQVADVPPEIIKVVEYP